MELTLDDTQRALMQEVLDSACRDIRYEIADTDPGPFKDHLHERESELRALLDLVGGPLPAREPVQPS